MYVLDKYHANRKKDTIMGTQAVPTKATPATVTSNILKKINMAAAFAEATSEICTHTNTYSEGKKPNFSGAKKSC